VLAHLSGMRCRHNATSVGLSFLPSTGTVREVRCSPWHRFTSISPRFGLKHTEMSYRLHVEALARLGVRRASALPRVSPQSLAVPVSRRPLHSSPSRLDIPSWPNPPMPQPPVGPSDDLGPRSGPSSRRKKVDEDSFWYSWSHSPSFQAALTTVVGLGMVFGAGVGYLEWYKAHVLHRVS
jgi:hypothetical protein